MMRSVDRILAVFESFTPSHNALSLQEIADRIELPKSTAFRIVRSLEEAGYLIRLEDQKYCLSLRFTRLAGLVQSTLGIREIARPVMVELATKAKETVSIHMVSGRNRICIDSLAVSSSPLRTVTQPGEQLPLHNGSASKVLMAYMAPATLKAMLPAVSRLAKRTAADMQAEFATIREKGHAVSHGERNVGLSAVSAPIWDLNEEVHYCISVNGPSVRMQGREKEMAKLVMKAARDISLQFGGRPHGD